MRISVNLSPTGDWPAILAAAQAADSLGFDSVGFLDHYHTPAGEDWSYLCGWSLYGALALATERGDAEQEATILERLAVITDRGEGDAPVGGVGLGGHLDESLAFDPLEGAADGEALVVEVDVAPAQAEEFAAAHAGA